MSERRQPGWIFFFVLATCSVITITSIPLFTPPVQALSTTIVIRQVYGGGGNSGAPYQNDFIELFNRGTLTVTFSNWSVQYASAAGASWSVTPITGTLAPGQSYLIRQASGGANGVALPTADVTGTVSMAAGAGKVALVNNATALTGSGCPLSVNVVDFIGYGTTANCFEGASYAPVPSNTLADLRASNGCTETDNNSTDFATGAPAPRNTTSPLSPCSAPPPPVPPGIVVVSQVYGGGGNSGAPYQNDFIELLNRSTASVSLTGWSVQYASAGGTGAWTVTNLSGSLSPGQYFLVKQASGGANGVALPTADVTGTISMAASAGKVALLNTTIALNGACPTNANIVDLVGYGTGAGGANCYEGTGAAPSPSNTTAVFRNRNGCTDTDNNATDLFTSAVAPRNSSNTTSCSTVAERLLITEVLYDETISEEGQEFIEITNPLTYTVYLDNYKIGDEEVSSVGGGEGMYQFPFSTPIIPGQVLLIARNANQFLARFGSLPNFELVPTGTGLTDNPSVPNLSKYTAWSSGSFALSNSGDEIVLLGPLDQIADSVGWENANLASIGLYYDPLDKAKPNATEPFSLQRYGLQDVNNMIFDFFHGTPSPGTLVMPPAPPPMPPGRAMGGGMLAYWGDIHSHSTTSDGSGPPRMAFATARANGLHFFGLTDHDAWLTLDGTEFNEMTSAANAANVDGTFVALRGFEYSHDSKGHINVFGTNTWVSRDDPNYDTLPEFYTWLAAQTDAVAQFNHPDPSYGGTFDFFAFNAGAANKIVMIEVGNNGNGYARYEPQYPQSLSRGWRVAPTNNSDNHDLTWGIDTPHRTGIIASSLTRASVLDAFRARRVFATEDANLAIALQGNGAWMGSTIRNQLDINFTVLVSDPNPEPIQLFFYDNGTLVRSQSFPNSTTPWNVVYSGTPQHYYYVRAVQADGDVAYTAPIWTDGTPLPTPIPPTSEPKENKKFLGPSSAETAHGTGVGITLDLEACVTVPPGVFSDRYIYVQDHTGGIRVYMASAIGNFPPMKLHDRVAVRGRTQGVTAERELVVDDASTIQVRGTCAPVTPKSLPTGSVTKSVEGLLVQVQGVVKNIDQSEFILNDGSGDVLVYVDFTTRIRLPRITNGQTIRVSGVVSRVHSRPAILPRYDTDIAIPTAITPTRTSTPVRSTASLTPTRTLTLRPTASVTPTQVSTTTPTPRAFIRATPEPIQSSAPIIDARAAAFVGGTGSIVAGFVFFGLAALLMRRR